MATLARASHSYRELRGMQGDSSSVWGVKLVVHAWCLLWTSVTCSCSCRTVIRLTQHRLIWE